MELKDGDLDWEKQTKIEKPSSIFLLRDLCKYTAAQVDFNQNYSDVSLLSWQKCSKGSFDRHDGQLLDGFD